ncbi:hypothetical protein JK386_01780 [Nocardioides sp. zg-536]|uniref:Uncharacterized protein n=1 Tax=Nocardioides faecalis TaxID=2803858 RepID=A0A938Y3J9_9ACTN|nr:hypothetical protein [Nocardioides faecalis]MBM9458624.1 hypothetical protein [Nocardioides faecalis]QVI58622.1 hypothetical protein KG111_16870 [Nocardioides faecalis]
MSGPSRPEDHPGKGEGRGVGRDLAQDVVAAAAAERRTAPRTAVESADLADKYDQMLRLADLFDDAGAQMRQWAQLGRTVLTDPDVTETAALSPRTWNRAEDELRALTGGKHGLLSRSIELDADALVLRATVLTYRWIDELQAAAYQTLGSIAGRAIGYLAPQVNLGGAIVAAGLIETEALDRDGVTAYLNELAASNPDLMEHVTTAGGLLDSLQMRGLLTAGVLSGEAGRSARAGGLRAIGVAAMDDDWTSALRDVAVAAVDPAPAPPPVTEVASGGADLAPAGLEDLMALLCETDGSGETVRVLPLGPGRLVAFLAGDLGPAPAPGRLRLVSGDHSGHAAAVVRALAAATDTEHGEHGDSQPDSQSDSPVRVMLVGRGTGGAVALDIATRSDLPGFVVDQVVTANAPSAQVPHLPDDVRVLSMEDRADPVGLLGSLINASAPNRLTVVYESAEESDLPPLVAGGRAADRAGHPDLVAVLTRWRELGYLRQPA